MASIMSSENVQGVEVVRLLFDEINREQREEIKKNLKDLLNNGSLNFIIDLSKVGFISSLVIATIIFFSKEVKENDGLVKISGLTKEKRSIFEITHLDKIFELYETEIDALESFKK